ncbi:MAG: autotransporter-associated beta strand repeat-containing protein, partial [Planctomycetia bacterium]|nr:autotransporter-associated beta strand repeat-containing protein [Planctomycetia bacterium]
MRNKTTIVNIRRFTVAAACLAAWCAWGQTALAQTFLTLNTGSSVMWNTTLWSGGGLPPQTATQVGQLMGGGTMTIDASSTNTTPDALLIGWGGNFNVQVTGGTLTTGTSTSDGSGTFGLTIGESGTGTFTQTGGLVTAPLVNLGRVTGGNGTYTLSGGTLSTARITRGAGGGATLNLNGGTIRVSGTSAALIGSTVTTSVQSGGAIFDTAGFDATVASTLSGSGGLTKNGSGMLTLTATNTFTGGVTVAGGTLQIGNNTLLSLPALGGYSLANGSTLVFSLNGANNSSGTATISGTGNVTFAGETTAGNWYSTGAFAANGLTYTGTTTVNLDNAGNALYVENTAGKTLPSSTILNVLRGVVNLRQNQTVAGLTGTGGYIGGNLNAPTLTSNVASGTSYTSASALIDNGAVLTVTKSGGGTQVLTGASTYTGTTTINAGTLQIGSGTSGSLSASTVITGSAGGTLAFGRTDGYGGNVANSIRGG